MRRFSFLFLLLASLATAAQAESPVEIGTVTLNGNGCPSNVAVAEVKPENGAISLTFGAFKAEASGVDGASLSRKMCSVAIPVKVAPGYRVATPLVETKINVRASEGASAKLRFESFFVGSTGPVVEKVYEKSATYKASNRVPADKIAWSGCGENSTARVSISVVVNNPSSKLASGSLDKATVLPLKVESCTP